MRLIELHWASSVDGNCESVLQKRNYDIRGAMLSFAVIKILGFPVHLFQFRDKGIL